MKKQTLAAIMIVVIALVGVGVFYLAQPYLKKKSFLNASDAKSAVGTVSVRIGGDGYAGYGVFRTAEFQKNLLGQGLTVDFKDDNGAYAERLQKFAAGELDMIVLPVNSYLENGKDWPGVIVAGIAESKGADAIVGRKDKFATGSIKALDDPTLRIAFTPQSPSEFLLNSVRSHFGFEGLNGTSTWRVEATGSEDVRKRLVAGQADAGILWEPDVSKALESPELVVIFGSDKFSGLIVDVLVVRRDYYLKNEETVHKLLQTYFVTLRLYAMDRQKFVADMAQVTGLPAKQTEAMLGKIDFLDVQENATKFFGVKMGDLPAAEGMVNVILSCMDVMKRVGVPLASELKNPYELTNRGMIERLVTTMPQAIGQAAAAKDVPALDLAAWRALKEVGALRIEPISFQSGAELLDQTGKEEVDRVAYLLLNNYPGYRVIVRGHTGPGDEQANRELSQNRAEVVKRYLEVTHSIDPDRMLAEGMGFTQPPKARPGESQRSLRSRAPRVEFVLVEGNDL